MKRLHKRWLTGIVCVTGLVMIYLFQKTYAAALIPKDFSALEQFLINRSIRFVANDICMIGLIWALFPERKYVVFAIWVQLAGLVFFLIPYFILKIYFPAYNGPLISYLHRLVLNPTLLLLLIPAYYYQKHGLQRKA